MHRSLLCIYSRNRQHFRWHSNGNSVCFFEYIKERKLAVCLTREHADVLEGSTPPKQAVSKEVTLSWYWRVKTTGFSCDRNEGKSSFEICQPRRRMANVGECQNRMPRCDVESLRVSNWIFALTVRTRKMLCIFRYIHMALSCSISWMKRYVIHHVVGNSVVILYHRLSTFFLSSPIYLTVSVLVNKGFINIQLSLQSSAFGYPCSAGVSPVAWLLLIQFKTNLTTISLGQSP